MLLAVLSLSDRGGDQVAVVGCMTCFCQLCKPAVADYALPFFVFFPQLGVKHTPFQKQLKRGYFRILMLLIYHLHLSICIYLFRCKYTFLLFRKF